MQLDIRFFLVNVVINPAVMIWFTLYFIDRDYDFVFNIIGNVLNYIFYFYDNVRENVEILNVMERS